MKFPKILAFILLTGLLVSAAPSLPTVYVIGDSISMRYGPFLEKYVQGVWQYDRKSDDGQAAKNLDVPVGANGGDSRMVLAFLKIKTAEKAFQPDVLLLNCGLHDIKRNPETNVIQVDSVSYRKNLEAIWQLLHKRNIRLVWMRTTSVEDERHNTRSKAFKRYARDLDAYNAIADEVMRKHGVAVIDLYTFTRSLGSDHFVDHVHYDDSAMQLQAAYIAGFLQGQLPLTQQRK
ncbi:SGNH/GDSL hydrolase family protein [Larkinella rosea]|uniref:SGNH/GDSL hydrolase family protein n=1 Tax=Larkinella rosea TaxID=2025312 RepID=A0A3P1BAX2_9BACT|nr:SGNH/GDSL hydrolase family protein [Larkinella rosea]RRA98081.1 SGNH/GDSL hydrolase family protein [Larkinella rosea]